MALIAKSNSTAVVHPDRSSIVSLSPTKGILTKIKEGRSDDATRRELEALSKTKELLGHYNQKNDDLRIDSPEPLGIVEEDGTQLLQMSFEPGVNGESLCSNYFFSTNDSDQRDLFAQFLQHVGRLLAIKEHEGVVHDDFQLRHVLFEEADSEIGTKPKLTLIDVENLYIPETPQKSSSHIQFFDELFRLVTSSEKSRIDKVPSIEQRLAILGDLKQSSLVTKPALIENLDFLDQLFRSRPVVQSRVANRKPSQYRYHPVSIYGEYSGRNNPRHEIAEINEFYLVKKNAFFILTNLLKGYNTVNLDLPRISDPSDLRLPRRMMYQAN
jgi:hypothetical protein